MTYKNGYRAYHRGRMTEVWAYGQNEARAIAASKLRCRQSEVIVILAVKGRIAA